MSLSKEIGYSLAAKGAMIISQLLITAWIARYVTPAQFGLWSLFFHGITIMSILDLGIGGGALRNILTETKDPLMQQAYFFSSFVGMIVLFGSMGVLSNVLVQGYFTKEIRDLFMIFVVLMGIKTPFSICGNGFYAFGEIQTKAWIDLFEQFAICSIIALVILAKGTFIQLFTTYYGTIAAVSVVGFLIFLYRRKWTRPSWQWSYHHFKILFKLQMAFWVQNLASVMLFSLSPYCLARVVNLKELGEYALVYRTCCLMLGVHFVALNVLWTKYSIALQQQAWQRIRVYLYRSLFLTVQMWLIAGIVLIPFYNSLIFFWTRKVVGCQEIVILYWLWSLLYACINCFSIFLNAANKLYRQTVFLIVGAALNMILGWSLATPRGVLVACIVSLAPLFLSNYYEWKKWNLCVQKNGMY